MACVSELASCEVIWRATSPQTEPWSDEWPSPRRSESLTELFK